MGDGGYSYFLLYRCRVVKHLCNNDLSTATSCIVASAPALTASRICFRSEISVRLLEFRWCFSTLEHTNIAFGIHHKNT